MSEKTAPSGVGTWAAAVTFRKASWEGVLVATQLLVFRAHNEDEARGAAMRFAREKVKDKDGEDGLAKWSLAACIVAPVADPPDSAVESPEEAL